MVDQVDPEGRGRAEHPGNCSVPYKWLLRSRTLRGISGPRRLICKKTVCGNFHENHGYLQPGERAAARPGGHRARNRRHPPERRNGHPGTVQGKNQRAAFRPAGVSLHHFCTARGGGAVCSDPLPNPGGHRTAP